MPYVRRKLTVQVLALLLLGCWCCQTSAHEETALEILKAVGKKVSQVVSKNMPACIAVSDGTGFGSGVVVSEDGLVLTAAHVMAAEGTYELIFPSGRTVKAKPLGKNLNIDAGMLQIIDPGPWPYVEISPQDDVDDGTWVVSLGHSGGYELGRTPPVRTGRVLKSNDERLFTDAVLIGGDSGGPLFDLEGRLIGIHSSIGDTVAENRHVTMKGFRDSWDRMLAGQAWGELPELDVPNRKKRRGVIGVRVDLTAKDCRIRVVNDGSPADEIGLQPGDVVLEFNSIKIRDGQHLIDVIRQHEQGDVCPILIERNGTKLDFEIQLN